MKFEIVPAHDLPFEAQARIFNRAFASYLVAFKEMDASGLAQFICAQGVDLCYSRFGRVNGDLAVFGYVNCTGNISRLAAMGVVPDARRSGAANFLLSHLINEAKARAVQAMVLECFEQNGAALVLYRKNKFREVTRLFGWRRSPGPLNILAGCDTEEISLIEASHIPCRIDFPDLPWQVSRYAVAKIPEGRAYRIKNVCAVISDPLLSPSRIFALLGYDYDELASAQKVIAALLQRFPENEFFARQVFPESLGAQVFEPLGFVREPLNQFLMRQDLP